MRAWFGEHAEIVKWVAIGAVVAFGALILLDWLNSRGKSQQAAASDDMTGLLTYMGPADVTITENQYPFPTTGQPAPIAAGVGVTPTPVTGPSGAPAGQPAGHEGGPTPIPTPHPAVFPHPHATHTAAAHPAKAVHPTRPRAPVHEHAPAHPRHHPPHHPGHGLTIPPGGHPFGGGASDWAADIFYPTRD